MQINKKRKLNLTRLYYIISFFVLFILLIVVGIKFYKDFIKKEPEKETEVKQNLDALELYGYTLDDKDTELYKDLFLELKEELNKEEIDEELYASILSKLFIVDVYTLDNKLTSTDIGGLEFIHYDMVENFKINLGDTMYNHIESNLYNDRNQSLPMVSAVEVTQIEKTKYEYNEEKFEGYLVNLKWEYETDLGYENSSQLILIKDNNKLNVVEKVSD